eukprot:ANDGO_04034.mRNA.1 Putative cation exchanger C521.04c
MSTSGPSGGESNGGESSGGGGGSSSLPRSASSAGLNVVVVSSPGQESRSRAAPTVLTSRYPRTRSAVDFDSAVGDDDAMDDSVRFAHHTPRTVDERKRANNMLFGFVPWMGPSTASGPSAAAASHQSAVPSAGMGSSSQNQSLVGGLGGSAAVRHRHAASSDKNATMVQIPSHANDDEFIAPSGARETAATRAFLTPGNVVYVMLVGWWASLLHLVMGIILGLLIVTIPHAKLCFALAKYLIWPFGGYIELATSQSGAASSEDANLLLGSAGTSSGNYGLNGTPAAKAGAPPSSRTANRGGSSVRTTLSTIVFHIIGIPVLALVHAMSWAVCWFLIVLIPMAKVHFAIAKTLYSHSQEPQKLLVSTLGQAQVPPPASASIIILTYAAVNKSYLKYTVDGMNVALVNLLPFAVVTILLHFLSPEEHSESQVLVRFVLSLVSIIPLAYYIGAAVASISAQTSFAVGAVLNATFGSIIELLIYVFSIQRGLNDLVTAGVTGALLGAMLLLPGLSMIVGGLKHKMQHFNINAAGVTSVMLLIAVVGDYTPTMFYLMYGQYDFHCKDECSSKAVSLGEECEKICIRFEDMTSDPIYENHAKKLLYAVAVLLPLAYVVGLIFTLKTHSHYYQNKEDPIEKEKRRQKNAKKVTIVMPEDHAAAAANGTSQSYQVPAALHDEETASEVSEGSAEGEEMLSEWSLRKCIIVLVVATASFALVAEALTDSIQPFLDMMGISQRVAGLTIIAIVPNIAELVNAIMFAYNNNITLALEIGNVAAIQVSLIQMPFLVFLSWAMFQNNPGDALTLIFAPLDVFSVFVAVIILSYISIDGRCNYFEGAALILVYLIFVMAFVFSP